MKFRNDINGLRAIAVLAVVIFHYDRELLQGGFSGVDVFFVISGYLMTGIILRGLKNDNFSISQFYLARARRIAPALAGVCSLLLIFGFCLLSPNEYETLGKHVVGSLGFFSNIMYWKESGYFDIDSQSKWLLHTWSLSVEWQFYLIYPVVLSFIGKVFGIKRLGLLVVFSTILSFVICIYATSNWPSAAFYLLPTRAWEMLLGGIAFLYPLRANEKLKKHMELVGFLLVFGSYIILSENDVWPGYLAIFPALGAFLVLWSERFDSRISNNVICQKIGTASYSIYLWHWPILVFMHYYFEPAGYLLPIYLLVSILLGFLSYKYIEERYNKISLKKLFLAVLTCAFVASIGWKYQPNLFLNKLPVNIIDSIKRQPAKCFNVKNSHTKSEWFCSINKDNEDPYDYFLFGDSHMFSMLPAMERFSVENGYKGAYVGYNGCPPLINVIPLRTDQTEKNCFNLNARIIRYVIKNNIKNVVIVARWTYYSTGSYSSTDFSYLGTEQSSNKSKEKSFKVFKDGMLSTIQKFSDANVKVFLLLQVPQQKKSSESLYVKALKFGINNDSLEFVSVDRKVNAELQAKVNSFLYSLAKDFDNLILIDPQKTFCNTNKCIVGNAESSYYFDGNHLSAYGALMLAPQLVDELNFN
jgi:peptidoglycan/LPS O-acetylase OafA/YrhL